MHVPVNALRVFEAAARLGSFKVAAEELALSPSAVSHAIAKLERDIGVILFDREGKRVSLTLDGQMLQSPVEEAFGLLRTALTSVLTRQSRVLRLHAAPSFAAQWLTPRLASFYAAHPGVEVQIAASTDYSRFNNDEFDADIVYRKPDSEGLICVSLGQEEVQPMCTPALAERIQTPSDLLEHILICSSLKAVTWEDWFRANEIVPPKIIGMRFDRSFMAIQAAADGLGVCLDSTRIAERELLSGRLVAPLRSRSNMLTESDHYLVYPRRNARRPIVQEFERWLLSELSKDPFAERGARSLDR
jgi:LysR family transcriptional regulator, glycine cleavage system transcriptional activator